MCLYVDHDDGWSTIHDGSHVARISHRCLECARTIDPGETYRYWEGLADGSWATQKMCAHCWAAIDAAARATGCPKMWWWDRVFDADPEDGGFFGDAVANHDHDLTFDEHVRLLSWVAGAARQWRDDAGELLPVPPPAITVEVQVGPCVECEGRRRTWSVANWHLCCCVEILTPMRREMARPAGAA